MNGHDPSKQAIDSPPRSKASGAGISPLIKETLATSNAQETEVVSPLLGKEEIQTLAAFFEILNQINEREKLC